MSSAWAREVELQAPVWVVCSKPSCFAMFWAGSGCWVAVPVARRVPQGAPKEGQGALWDSVVGREGSPKRAPCCRDSLFWESFGAPWGVWGGGLVRCWVSRCVLRGPPGALGAALLALGWPPQALGAAVSGRVCAYLALCRSVSFSAALSRVLTIFYK